ncbi:hypothetical protein EVG20_g9873 [Dentipellis fragilis]|uniref:Uncharacterized protein n=1 Tax=Dentipellis fragilis TaxID=205917 RepID=A0A4Y9XZJ0_9AGAM|nr:hypothetical protein EVG20_g9873 [Dentipellis fragilis]
MSDIFSVEGLVAVITGGGSGTYLPLSRDTIRIHLDLAYRHRPADGHRARKQRRDGVYPRAAQGYARARGTRTQCKSSPLPFHSPLTPVGPRLYTMIPTRPNLQPEPNPRKPTHTHTRPHLRSPRPCFFRRSGPREPQKHDLLIPLQADITSRPSLLAAAETVRTAHGHVDLLVNNAGIALSRHIQPPPPPTPRSAEAEAAGVRALQRALWDEASPDDFRTSFAVNVAGAYDCTVAFLDLLHAANANGRGRACGGVTSQVLTVSSVAGFRRDERVYSVPYALSKAATTHLGKMLVNLLKEYKIRSNVLAPGIFPSDMTAGVVGDEDVAQDVPLQRAGGADDMAGMILYLASRAGAYVNGTVHMLDGGRVATFPSTY